ncbi:MAG: FAD-dependent oxidoreductase [Candidatus Aenigmarchaeota archaeon]|nr:FAD-dependent oxidoreductase [Candidatus Aenigmarchaeota archaeon]
MIYDAIILGGGAAGLTAAIFLARKEMKTLVVTINVGGQNLLTEHEENYPGYLEKSGPKLMSLFEKQARSFGAEFVFGKATKVDKIENGFRVNLANGEDYDSRALILAYGKVPRALGIPGEDKFIGRGVSTSVVADAKSFVGKAVAIIGGGNSALEAADMMADIAKKVYIIHRRDSFRGDEVTVDKIKNKPHIEFVLNSVPVDIKGNKFVTALAVENVNTKQRKDLQVDGVFIEIGLVVDTNFVKHLVKVDEANEIVINQHAETSCTGIFAAGDVTNVPYKQTIISCGLGAIAALSAYMYLSKLEGKTGVKLDWG